MSATVSTTETSTTEVASMRVAASEAAVVSMPARVAAICKVFGAVLMIGLLFPEWIKGGANGLSANGGGGFGLLAVLTAGVALASAWRTLSGRTRESRIFGLHQLAGALGVAMFVSNLVYLWVFTTGGAPKWIYVAANTIAYASIVGLFNTGARRAERLPVATERLISLVTAVIGVGVMLAPTLEYTRLQSTSFTGYEPGAPRIGILLLIVGGVTALFGVIRLLDGSSFTEIGPYVLVPHATIALGILCFAPPAAWLISGLWGAVFDPGVGVIVSVVLGAALIATGAFEAQRRNAPGI